MKEKNDRQNSRSRYQGPRSERIKSGIEEIKKRRRDERFNSGRELKMMKDFTPIQGPIIQDSPDDTDIGDQEQGRQIKVESIGKTLGRNREAGSDTGNSGGASHANHRSARTKKENSRSDFGKSRKKPLSRSERKKLSQQSSEKTGASGPESKAKASASGRGTADVQEGSIGGSSFTNEGRIADVDLIFGEDLTRDESGRMKLFFNTRQSNYSGTRAERLEEKNKRLEIEGQFQDVVPYITPEEEEETEKPSGHRWGKLGLEIAVFLLLYEIVILAAFAIKPDLRVNVSGQVLEMRESLMDRFGSKKAEEETTEEEEPEIAETVVPSTEDTSAYPAFVNEAGAIAVKSPGTPIEAEAIGTGDSDPVELLFAGDVYLSDHVMEAYRDAGSISGVVSEGYQKAIAEADYFVVNEEFPFSSGGKQAEDKQFTFRVSPDNVNIFGEMGIDLVTLANNHTLDYGTEALMDTITTLDEAGIRHIGAGEDLSHAEEFVTVSIKGKKIAFVGATRVIPEAEWAAGESSPGVFSAYEDAELLKKIKDAKEQADFVVVYVHWGEERMESPNEVQKTLAHSIVDAGADLVIGAHPHVLQGIEYYKGVPIAYSLGNFVFGSSIPRTALLRVTIDEEKTEDESPASEEMVPEAETGETETSESANASTGEKTAILKLQLIPGKSAAGYTQKLDEVNDIAEFYSYITGISSGISIDGDGVVHQK